MLFTLGGVLPVQRRSDTSGAHDNARTFDACFRALADDACIAIFPEGVMHLDPTVRRLKTGAARIGLGAAESGVRGVVIVPIGLVYGDRGRFRSDATLRFGRPIVMDDWLERYTDDPFGTVGAVTERLADALAARPNRSHRGPNRAPRQRSRAVTELVVLAPAAALGMLANAPVLVAGLAARRVPDEMWQASTKGVGGTALLVLTWGTQLALLSRRFGVRRASVLTSRGAACGLATLRVARSPARLHGRVIARTVGAMITIPESARSLLLSGRLAHVVTINPDGSPQISLVWVGVDGDEIVLAHLGAGQKIETSSATLVSRSRSRGPRSSRPACSNISSCTEPPGSPRAGEPSSSRNSRTSISVPT